MTSPTPRLGLLLIEGTDTIPAPGGMKDKVNNAITEFDSAVGRIICTSATRPTTNLFAGVQAYETDTKRMIVNPRGVVGEWYVENQEPVGAGMVRAIRPVRNFEQDANHSAFPSAAVLPDGTVMVVWRQGTNHATNRDGVIKMSKSTNQGRTWGAATTILSGSPAGTDLRDPCVSLSADGSKVYLSYFKGTASLAAAGVFFRVSTDFGANWSSEVRVDNLPYAASSAPIVELNNGTLVMPFYGRSGAETFDSVWTAKSVNGGTTWAAPVRILNGQTATTNYQEPYLVMRGTIGTMAYRAGGASNIGISYSVDNTTNWSGVSTTFTGTGRPTLFYVNANALVCLYRKLSGGDAVMRTSRNDGGNWYPERLVDPSRSAAGWMTYAGGDKIGPNSYLCVLAQETSDTSSKLAVTCIGESGASTPFGPVPTDADALSSEFDKMLFATNFEQADGTLPDPWTTASGNVTVTNGELTSSSADNVPDFPRVFVNSNDVDIEADIYSSGPETGFAIIFRMINANSYLMFTVESSGANWRLYKVVSGVVTQLFSVTGSMNFATYHTYRVVAKGNGIWCYANGMFVTPNSLNYGQGFYSHQLSGGDMTTFSAGLYVGLKLNNQGSTVHKCRRFIVRK